MQDLLKLASDLIARPSVTPEDAGCQQLIAGQLEALGFQVESMPFGKVSNLFATHGSGSPVLALAGHTDVVPAGPHCNWMHPPFSPTLKDGMLFGRGAADMKGSLAAMLTAATAFLQERKTHSGTLAFLITSDEEGEALDGTKKVMQTLNRRGCHLDFCLLGEPSSEAQLGDQVRVGRRGSLSAKVVVQGEQGHIAYPALAVNPIHKLAPALLELTCSSWDQGNAYFPATSLQVSNIHAGEGVGNVIPGSLELWFNFRFSTEVRAQDLQDRCRQIFARHGIDAVFDWQLSGEPFLTQKGRLIPAVQAAIEETLGLSPLLSTSGGTSDGRFIAPFGTEVVELGPVNATIHKVDECVSVQALEQLTEVYLGILRRLLQ